MWLSSCKYKKTCLKPGLDSDTSCSKCEKSSSNVKKILIGGHRDCFTKYVKDNNITLPEGQGFLCLKCANTMFLSDSLHIPKNIFNENDVRLQSMNQNDESSKAILTYSESNLNNSYNQDSLLISEQHRTISPEARPSTTTETGNKDSSTHDIVGDKDILQTDHHDLKSVFNTTISSENPSFSGHQSTISSETRPSTTTETGNEDSSVHVGDKDILQTDHHDLKSVYNTTISSENLYQFKNRGEVVLRRSTTVTDNDLPFSGHQSMISPETRPSTTTETGNEDSSPHVVDKDILQTDHHDLKSVFNETISSKNLHQLKNGDQVNDEVINFYCAILVHRIKDNGIKICSTFLATMFMSSKNTTDKELLMTKFCKIKNPSCIFIPFHLNTSHWTLGYINCQEKKLEYFDHCFGRYDTENFDPITVLLEMCECLKISTEAWQTSRKKEGEIVKQIGDRDCGIYVCMDVLHLLQVEKSFQVQVEDYVNQSDVQMFRNRMWQEINDWKETNFCDNIKQDNINLTSDSHYRTASLNSLPNLGNTCHITAACWSLCSHITLEAVCEFLEATAHVNGVDVDSSLVSRSLLVILKHLMSKSDCTELQKISLQNEILHVMSSIYPDPNLQQDAGETFNKLLEIINLPGVNLRQKITCDSHSMTSMCDKPSMFPSMILYVPKNVEKISFQDLVDYQQSGSSTEWICPKNDTTICKSSTFQIIIGPPAPVITFVIERNCQENYISTINVEVSEVFRVIVHNPELREVNVEPTYKHQVCSYLVVSAVFHTYNIENNFDDAPRYSIPNPGKGHYLVCKSRETEIILCDDLQYPNLQVEDKDYILENGKNVVLVTAVLLPSPDDNDKVRKPGVDDNSTNTSEIGSSSEEDEESQPAFQNSTISKEIDAKLERSTESQRTTPSAALTPTRETDMEISLNIIITRLKSSSIILTRLMEMECKVLHQQLLHFFTNYGEEASTISGLFTDKSSYLDDMISLQSCPVYMFDRFGFQALKLLWNLPQVAIYKLTTGNTIELVLQDPEDQARTSSTRCLLRTCLSLPFSCNDNITVRNSKCEYLFHPLYPADLFPDGVTGFDNLYDTAKWNRKFYTELVCNDVTYLVGPTGTQDFWSNRYPTINSFLAAVTIQEIMFSDYFKQNSHLRSCHEVTGNKFKHIKVLKDQSTFVPSQLSYLRSKWKSLESEGSRLTRAASSTTVVETDISTVWKIFAAVLSVVPVPSFNWEKPRGFVDLTNGRRGALLASFMLPIPCIGVERNREVFDESVKLVHDAKNVYLESKHAHDGTKYLATVNVFMVNANYSTIQNFNGIIGCCMYIGNDFSTLTPDYIQTLPRIFASESMMFYYDCKTNEKNFDTYGGDANVRKKWYMTKLENCKQEANTHTVFIWIKKMKFWDSPKIISENVSLTAEPSGIILKWLMDAMDGKISEPYSIVTHAIRTVSDFSSSSLDQSVTSSSTHSSTFSPAVDRPRRTRLNKPVPTVQDPVPLTKAKKKKKKHSSANKVKSSENTSLDQSLTKYKLSKSAFKSPVTQNKSSETVNIYHKTLEKTNILDRRPVIDVDFESPIPGPKRVDSEDIAKCVEIAFNTHLSSGSLEKFLEKAMNAISEKQIGSLENTVKTQFTEEAKKQADNLILKKIEESTERNEKNIMKSAQEMKMYVKKSEHKKGAIYFKAAFETVANIANSSRNMMSAPEATPIFFSPDQRHRIHSRSRSRSRSGSKRSRSKSEKRSNYKKIRRTRSRSRSRSKSRTESLNRRSRSHSESQSWLKRVRNESSSRSNRSRSRERNISKSHLRPFSTPYPKTKENVADWSALTVSRYLSSKHFSPEVCDAFSAAHIHGRLLKEVNDQYIETKIRVQKNEQLFNTNQIQALVEVIQEVCN